MTEKNEYYIIIEDKQNRAEIQSTIKTYLMVGDQEGLKSAEVLAFCSICYERGKQEKSQLLI